MNQNKDRAIILSRVEYGERDRILTILCEESGKVSVLAKGVRSAKSRLAGGIELLSESEVSFIGGKSNLKTLTSARLHIHFDVLARDLQRMQLAFEHIKIINSISEEGGGQDYYDTLLTSLSSLNDLSIDQVVVDIWFNLQVLKISGSEPNLELDADDSLDTYNFDYDNQEFSAKPEGAFGRNELKLLRLCANGNKPPKIQNRLGSEDRLQALTRLLLKTNVTEV